MKIINFTSDGHDESIDVTMFESVVTTWQCEIITAKYRHQQYKTFGGAH